MERPLSYNLCFLFDALCNCRYNFVKEVGDGTFGNVWRAVNKQTGEFSLSRMNHPNIVKLKEVIRENDNMYFVFEYMNLISEIGAFKSFKAFFTCMSMDTFTVILSQYTLYRICLDTLLRYRAPEVLLQSYVYTSKVDMWAMGATLAELLSLCPLFPGASEAIYKVCNVIGSPTQETWLEGLNLASVINYQFPQAINLVERLCSWDPNNRPTAAEALQHPFFQSCYYVPPSLRTKTSVGQRGSLERQQQQSVKRLPATLTNTANYKPFNSYANAKANGPPFGACQTQRNLETAWNNKAMGSYHVRDAKYIPPPGRKSPCKWSQSQRQQQPVMKAGWVGESGDMFLRPTQPPNPYSRRIADKFMKILLTKGWTTKGFIALYALESICEI
ncbi:hypothetical protein HID58_006767 [Brassica napus]|uniref:Protein kinase domain-containing protein n=1 Tax=Brassica napus TaxID=3708 RepID=A0ABQ8EFB0_BRANA|nr:hypothetical protein HID58_006767 [Brassica napus]